ncbi:MAG: BatA domain-containing protein [candidate division WOR-3 bacterium]
MSLGNPSALWFAPLAALPIIIHLISIFWQKRRPFPWVELLTSAKAEGKRWRRITEWLVLAARTLAIAAAVLAFSRPSLGKAGGSVFVDVSASMEPYSPQLDIPGARYFARREWGAWTGVTKERGDPANALAGSSGYIVSDFQAGEWRGVKMKGSVPVLLPEPKDGNVAIASAVPESPAPSGSFTLEMTIKNYSNQMQTRSVTVSDRNKTIYAATTELAPGKDTTMIARVELSPGTTGLIAILEPGDLLAFDDTFYIPVSSMPEANCELLSDNPFLMAALFPVGYPSPIRELPGAEIAVVIGRPVAGKNGVAFIPDSQTAALAGIRCGVLANTSILGGKATVKQGAYFREGTPLLTDDAGRAIAIRWGDWVLVGFNPVPEATDIVFRGDFPVLVWNWVISLGEAPLAQTATVGEMLDPGMGEGFITGPEGRLARRAFSPDKPGFYTLVEGGKPKRFFAVNVDREESNTERLSREELKEAFGTEPVSLEEFLKQRGRAVNMAPWLIMVAIALLAAEGVYLGLRARGGVG